MTDDAAPPITQRDGVVLISGAALPLLYRSVLALIARRSRDGLAASPLVLEARTALYRACMSAQRRKGAAYHLALFRAINPAATLFGVLFIAQAALLAWWGLRAPTSALLPNSSMSMNRESISLRPGQQLH